MRVTIPIVTESNCTCNWRGQEKTTDKQTRPEERQEQQQQQQQTRKTAGRGDGQGNPYIAGDLLETGPTAAAHYRRTSRPYLLPAQPVCPISIATNRPFGQLAQRRLRRRAGPESKWRCPRMLRPALAALAPWPFLSGQFSPFNSCRASSTPAAHGLQASLSLDRFHCQGHRFARWRSKMQKCNPHRPIIISKREPVGRKQANGLRGLKDEMQGRD